MSAHAERQAQEVILRNRLGIAHALRSDPGAEYRDLGLGYCEQRRHRRRTISHVRSLEYLGGKITIEPAPGPAGLGHPGDPAA